MTPRAPAGSLYPEHSADQQAYSPTSDRAYPDDGYSTYSQSPGRPTLYSDPSAPSLGRPVGHVRQSFETAASSTVGGSGGGGGGVVGGGVVGSPFADGGSNSNEGGASLRPRKAHGGGAGGGQAGPRESIFNSVYNNSGSSLALPQRPFLDSSASSFKSASSPTSSSTALGSGGGGPSRPLSVHYLPQKYPEPHKQGQWAHRRAQQPPRLRKTGGGRAAFAAHEDRLPSDDGIDGGALDEDGGRRRSSTDGKSKHKLLWNRFKWTLFIADTILLAYSIAALVCCLLVWFNVWTNADTIRVANKDLLIMSTVAACLCLVTSLVGFAGVLLNNRAFLATFTFLCWLCFALLVVPGYVAYKKSAFNLEGKINYQWSRELGTDGRLRVQDQLRCCGYYSPYVEATVSATCYSRSNLPGCKGRFLRFQREVLVRWYTISFALVPVQLAIIIAGLLCSNHVTYRFTKGLTPKQYRLNLDSLAFVMDGYAGEIAAAYGPEVAYEAMTASQTNLATLQYSNHAPQQPPAGGHKSKLSWSGFSTPTTTTSANPSRTSLGQHPSAGSGQAGDDYRMSQLGSEIILDERDHPRRQRSSESDDDDDEADEERQRLRDAEKRGWYAGRAF